MKPLVLLMAVMMVGLGVGQTVSTDCNPPECFIQQNLTPDTLWRYAANNWQQVAKQWESNAHAAMKVAKQNENTARTCISKLQSVARNVTDGQEHYSQLIAGSNLEDYKSPVWDSPAIKVPVESELEVQPNACYGNVCITQLIYACSNNGQSDNKGGCKDGWKLSCSDKNAFLLPNVGGEMRCVSFPEVK